MVANIRGYTPNYAFKLVNFDTPRWHTLEYANWTQLDSMLLQAGIPNIRGEWIYSTRYYVGDRVFDSTTGVLYRCLVEHTSAGTGTFADDRALHPTYWTIQTTGVPIFRGQWQTSATYSLGDIVFINAYQYYLCIDSHLSSPAFATDAAKWTLVFDATAAVNTTNANATASSNSASQAATSATNAATSATNAQASAVESAAQAAKLFGTSTSSNTIGLTAKTFVTQANKYFNVGKFIMVRANLDPINNWMWGQVSSYSGTSLVINAITSGGAGTFVDWIIDVSGSRGAIGPQGIQGELGPPLVIKGTVTSASALPPTGNTIGDMWIATDNQHLYIWDGTMWDDAGPLGTSTTTTADNAPSNPKDGDMWWESDSGIFWVYYDDGNTSQWVQAGGAAASINQNAVLKTGDTMTGDLTIAKTLPVLVLNKSINATNCVLRGQLNGSTRWQVQLGNDDVETGSDAGSNFTIQNFSDAGAFKGWPVVINRATGATSLTGDLTITKTTPNLTLNKTTASNADLVGAFNGSNRWTLRLGDGNAETGGNAGSNFNIYRWADNGTFIDIPLGILRSTGQITMSSTVASTSPITGALVVGGGLGVGGAISVGSPTAMPINAASLRAGTNDTTWAMACRPTGAVGYCLVFENSAAANVGNITSGATNTAYSTASDASLKEDLKSFDAGSIIDNTNVYDFAWKSTKERSFGVIAQQAVDVYPLAVTHTEKNDKQDEWWGVDYSKYVPVLLQELKALRQRVAELEGKSTTPEAPKRGRGSK